MPTNYYTSSGPNYTFGRAWTPAVKVLILSNAVVFLLQNVFSQNTLFNLLALQIPEVFSRFRLWQMATYMFLHAGFWHLAFNMFALWMFGCEVEEALGTRRFYAYYFITGIGAGAMVALVGRLAGEASMTVGASGAIFGVLLAYGILFAERSIMLLVFFILPIRMKAKTMVLLFAAFEFIAGVGNAFGRVSHLAHLSGLLIGYLYFLFFLPERAPRWAWFHSVKNWWQGRRFRNQAPGEDPVDSILEKISQQGINSLTRRERDILSEASRRSQHHHRNN